MAVVQLWGSFLWEGPSFCLPILVTTPGAPGLIPLGHFAPALSSFVDLERCLDPPEPHVWSPHTCLPDNETKPLGKSSSSTLSKWPCYRVLILLLSVTVTKVRAGSYQAPVLILAEYPRVSDSLRTPKGHMSPEEAYGAGLGFPCGHYLWTGAQVVMDPHTVGLTVSLPPGGS